MLGQILKSGFLLNSIGKVGAIIQLVKYQYFKKLFIKSCSILLHWLYRFNTVRYKVFYTQMKLRHLLLSQWMFALEKLIGRIVKTALLEEHKRGQEIIAIYSLANLRCALI